MTDKIYVVTASANKGQNWIICKALYGGILGSDIKKTAQAMLEEEYQDIKMHGKKIPRKYFKLVEYSADNTELLKQIEQLQAENAALRERLDKAVELPCKIGDKVYIPWVWNNQSGIMEAPVVTIRLYPYVRKYEIRLETDSLTFAQKYQYGNFNDKDFGTLIFTTPEAAEARLIELQGGKE